MIMDLCPEYNRKAWSIKDSDSEELEKALALIISCTRRVKRPLDLVTLVEIILYAKGRMGSLEAVGESVRLSVQQLKDFLAVNELCAEVKALVKKRAIDSVDIVKTISTLPNEKQKSLADHLVKGRITSKDIRIIASFSKKFPYRSIAKIVKDYEKTRDTRVYVAEFRLPAHFTNLVGLRRRFETIVGKSEIKKLQLNENVVVLEITALGHKKLREAVRESKMTLRRFISATFSELGERK